MRKLSLSFLLLLTVAFAIPQAASANILNDCADGTLSGNYSSSQIKNALNNLDGDLTYSDCANALSSARTGGSGSGSGKAGSGSGSGSGSAAGAAGTTAATAKNAAEVKRLMAKASEATPEAKAEAAKLATNEIGDGDSFQVDDTTSVPAAALKLGSANNDLPTPVVAMLVACGVVALSALSAISLNWFRRRRAV